MVIILLIKLVVNDWMNIHQVRKNLFVICTSREIGRLSIRCKLKKSPIELMQLVFKMLIPTFLEYISENDDDNVALAVTVDKIH